MITEFGTFASPDTFEGWRDYFMFVSPVSGGGGRVLRGETQVPLGLENEMRLNLWKLSAVAVFLNGEMAKLIVIRPIRYALS